VSSCFSRAQWNARPPGGRVLLQPADLLAGLVDAPIAPVRFAREGVERSVTGMGIKIGALTSAIVLSRKHFPQ
jgi:hypothetical protein